MRQGRLPDFVIIGAMKCGTTSLHGMLDAHPGIFMSREKELAAQNRCRRLTLLQNKGEMISA